MLAAEMKKRENLQLERDTSGAWSRSFLLDSPPLELRFPLSLAEETQLAPSSWTVSVSSERTSPLSGSATSHLQPSLPAVLATIVYCGNVHNC